MGDGGVRFENASVGVSEIGVKARAGFGFDKTGMHWSHPESPHEFIPIESLLSVNEVDLLFFVPPEPVDVRH